MSFILSLDTCSTACSVAIHESGKIVSQGEIYKEHSHGAKLALLIQQVLANIDLKPDDLAAIAICGGPGSYTGLRIGTSTAKGLCYALNIPLISVDSLSVLLHQLLKSQAVPATLFCPMLDARRMEVYCALLDSNLKFIEPIQAKVIDEGSFIPYLDQQPIQFFGDGAAKCVEVIRHPNATFVRGINPTAASVGELAFLKFEENKFEDLVHYEPFYLKEFLIKAPKSDLLLNK